jgi:hypothetical protein
MYPRGDFFLEIKLDLSGRGIMTLRFGAMILSASHEKF